MSSWKSVGTVIENGETHVLQQKVRTHYDGGVKSFYDEHRLISLSGLEGVRPNASDVEGVDHVA